MGKKEAEISGNFKILKISGKSQGTLNDLSLRYAQIASKRVNISKNFWGGMPPDPPSIRRDGYLDDHGIFQSYQFLFHDILT